VQIDTVNEFVGSSRLRRALVLVVLVMTVACARPSPRPAAGLPGAEVDAIDEEADYDPWQPFNERVFTFNHDVLDRWVVKPAARGWAWAAPEAVRRGIRRFIDNLDMPRRFVNNLLQGRPLGAGREAARFAYNTTLGVAGIFDVASAIHIEPSDTGAADTLGLYGVGAGPYLVLPSLPPLTVRDAVGRGLDALLDPLGYFVPFFVYPVRSIATAINDRSVDLERFANIEESVLDLYSAARNGYLQRRRHALEQVMDERRREWEWTLPKEPRSSAIVSSTAEDRPT
jgi:phospholipid-binding lipoprotein MlaA